MVKCITDQPKVADLAGGHPAPSVCVVTLCNRLRKHVTQDAPRAARLCQLGFAASLSLHLAAPNDERKSKAMLLADLIAWLDSAGEDAHFPGLEWIDARTPRSSSVWAVTCALQIEGQGRRSKQLSVGLDDRQRMLYAWVAAAVMVEPAGLVLLVADNWVARSPQVPDRSYVYLGACRVKLAG